MLMDREQVLQVVAALELNPPVLGEDDGSLEWLNVKDLALTLASVLDEPPQQGMLYGIQL